jgi:hypothetical protein
MKKLALVTLMVLGTSTVASASPFRFSARASFRFGSSSRYQPAPQPQPLPPRVVIVRDHRTNRSWEVTPCHDVSYNVSGFYSGGAAGDVQLTQRGNRIFGTFDKGGIMEGVIENGKITYHWSQGQYQGLGFWYIDGHGKLFGTWGAKNSDSSGGNWNLVLAQRPILY